ncbi:DNA gyrase inhibitor YacG [Qipengyuania marisflavi]|uniref:DNA gyrase inhibitor YacG n=1 Tax=Qipengyuania marisflavi TaxID=2486356 RepID=A0A5S3PCD7_9SPHN|nr:DNA gyrase inhibitor YacG [Qipengyuania marisflavi]TMM48909.1 DNA gyrase inhibitor YacG [Qipengyuania marisflavi]
MTSQAKPCPICRKPRSQEFAPFCSARCRDRDLARWFGEGYAVPGRTALPEEIAAAVVRGEED